MTQPNKQYNKPQFWQDKSPVHLSNGLPNWSMWLHQGKQLKQKIDTQTHEFSEQWAQRQAFLGEARQQHLQQRSEQLRQHLDLLKTDGENIANRVNQTLQNKGNVGQLWQEYLRYLTDSNSRFVQTLDILRERGDVFLEHESAGCPPVLDYDYEILLDAATFERPCNYVLLKILPPAGIEIDPNKRPYIIIDPRAGHGGGIGGFKHDSQVGVALASGHPVYFVAFKRMPEPTQTIADVCHAEAQFVQAVIERHPKSPEPVIVGNCQGGWAILILAATHPEITGPIVLNGAPVAAWSGKVGINPMRYKAGVSGGTWQSMLLADMGHGVFDGAWLVHNFEQLNPSRNYIGKYYDLYKNPNVNKERFLEFERWWGGFFLMNEAEIRWIVENIFVGNRLARNTAQLEAGTNIDLKSVKAPIVIFASYGDNITPPQQAVSWVMDTYTDEREIEICGQRIIYMIHEHVGHLGIFVSSSIANREHKSIATLLETVEVMPPGLYELVIDDVQGEGEQMQFEVSLAPRTFADLAKIDDSRHDEEIFRSVHNLSKLQTRAYESLVRPWVKTLSNDITAEWQRKLHPLRLQRSSWSSNNPLAKTTALLAKTATEKTADSQASHLSKNADTKNDNVTASQQQLEHMTGTNAAAALPAKQPDIADNLFYHTEKLMMDSLMMTLDIWRDWQGFTQENLFFGIWGLPWLRRYGKSEASRLLTNPDALSQAVTVKNTLQRIDQGGLIEAVMRMMVLVCKDSDGKIDTSKLAYFAKTLHQPPFNSIKPDSLATVMRDQTIMVRFDEAQAIQTLPKLLKTAADKQQATGILASIVSDKTHFSEEMQTRLNHIYAVLR